MDLGVNLSSAAVDLSGLVRLRFLALRRGFWFKVLSRLERSLVDLVLKVTKKVRSRKLALAIFSIVKKLEEALAGKVAVWLREFGVPLAERLSRVAQGWGNTCAREWAGDMGFIRYLAIMRLNGHPCKG